MEGRHLMELHRSPYRLRRGRIRRKREAEVQDILYFQSGHFLTSKRRLLESAIEKP